MLFGGLLNSVDDGLDDDVLPRDYIYAEQVVAGHGRAVCLKQR